MSALTYQCQNFKFSLSFDGLTVYYKFKRPSMGAIFEAYQESVRKNDEYERSRSTIKENSDYEKNIHRDDDDHAFYHLDDCSLEDTHAHWKFRTPMTRKKLELILQELKKHQLISDDEETGFLAAYDERYIRALHDLCSSLSRTCDIDIDTRAIINYIKSCNDNDIIHFLHQALLSDRFNYLRVITAAPLEYLWQGTDTREEVVETSKQWAMIQKAISLQLANNIRTECDRFSDKVARERATQLRMCYPFFALKRKSPICTDRFTSSLFTAFATREETKFTEKYEKFFRRY